MLNWTHTENQNTHKISLPRNKEIINIVELYMQGISFYSINIFCVKQTHNILKSGHCLKNTHNSPTI